MAYAMVVLSTLSEDERLRSAYEAYASALRQAAEPGASWERKVALLEAAELRKQEVELRLTELRRSGDVALREWPASEFDAVASLHTRNQLMNGLHDVEALERLTACDTMPGELGTYLNGMKEALRAGKAKFALFWNTGELEANAIVQD
ncbi:hypothetical protein MO973_25250 [Paenibacillus sp. TRM 82003]|nr:hypothetical protein [Paenibacillus sp. TRM 82003]